MIRADVAGAVCRAAYGDVEREQGAPCAFSVPDGTRFTLTVTRPGHVPFRQSWTARADRAVEAHLVKAPRPTSKHSLSPKKKPARPEEPPKPPSRPRAKKPETIGNGTLDVEDL
jgi:hypothetical protein